MKEGIEKETRKYEKAGPEWSTPYGRVQEVWLSPPQLGAQPEGSNRLPRVVTHLNTHWDALENQEVAQHLYQERRLFLMEWDFPISLLHSQADLDRS